MIDLPNLMQHCAPGVTPSVLQAIIGTESGFDPLALHVNGNVRLRSPPKTAAQAAHWSDWLIRQGYSVDMGLMQINSRNLSVLNLTPAGAFDPCRNIRAGAAILRANYHQAERTFGPGTKALLQAISAYNTGTPQGGFRNGYVARVLMNGSNVPAAPSLDLTCLLIRCAPHKVESAPGLRSATADTEIGGFGVAP
jgi:type IV secretion system protein VirB1